MNPIARTSPARSGPNTEFSTGWGSTASAPLDMPPTRSTVPAEREAIRGLVTREVDEPGLFERFFG